MKFQTLYSALLATAPLLFIIPAKASPFWGIDARYSSLQVRDLFVDASTTCKPIVLGAKQTEIGQVCVGISGGTLTVTYRALDGGCTYSDAHVFVGTSPPQDRNPGGFPYTSDNGFCTISTDQRTVTCTIPVQGSWRNCEKTLYIATHASVVCSSGGGTVWGMGTCFGGTGGNCAKYWSFTTHCYCPSVSTYPQEISETTTTYTSTSTTEFLTSTTVTYTTSSISEYTTTQFPETTITSTSTSTFPLSSTTYTLTCTNPYS